MSRSRTEMLVVVLGTVTAIAVSGILFGVLGAFIAVVVICIVVGSRSRGYW
jgi:hypothetical protein